MSTPPTAGPHDGERRKSLGKYVKRMSSVFKREKPTKGAPEASSAAVAPAPPVVEQPEEAPRADARDAVATQEGAQEPAKAASIKQEQPVETPAAA